MGISGFKFSYERAERKREREGLNGGERVLILDTFL
jgi:hypothetical protein